MLHSYPDYMEPNTAQYSIFKDCIARRVLSSPASSSSATPQAENHPSELHEFFSYLALEALTALPQSIQNASYQTRNEALPKPDYVDTISLDNTPTSVTDTLVSYEYASDDDDAITFLRKSLTDYLEEACVAPPTNWSATRTRECEICEREIPLTYHHLIPRSVHAKVLKKGWHPEEMLGSVAWLCRPCHSTVHHAATNEELAHFFYTVDLLLERDDIQKWRKYATQQRFGVRRG